MYCCHCGKEIDEHKLEAKQSSYTIAEDKGSVIDASASVEYICPRCGHLIHKGTSEGDIKTLAAASHAEIQRGRNFFANGMSLNCVGTIILILAVMFFLLSKKASAGFNVVVNSPEFIVSVTFFAVSACLISSGIVLTILGLVTKHKYQKLLVDIQNETFYQ